MVGQDFAEQLCCYIKILLVAFGLFDGVLLMASLRWRLLLKAHGIDYSLHDTFALTLIGLFFSQVMIGTTGGDMVKAYVVAREQKEQRSAAVISVLFDRALGLFVLLMVALVAILFNIGAVMGMPLEVFKDQLSIISEEVMPAFRG